MEQNVPLIYSGISAIDGYFRFMFGTIINVTIITVY